MALSIWCNLSDVAQAHPSGRSHALASKDRVLDGPHLRDRTFAFERTAGNLSHREYGCHRFFGRGGGFARRRGGVGGAKSSRPLWRLAGGEGRLVFAAGRDVARVDRA